MKKLYLVTNSDKYTEDEFLNRIEDALKSGVDILQLREKVKTDREILNLGKKVKTLCDKYNVPMLIDDKVHIAWALNVGVHLGNDDLPINYGRKLLPNSLIGATSKTVETAKLAEKNGADYLGVGAIFKTATKVKTIITSVETLKNIKKNVNIPVYAIGGLTLSNLDILKGSNVDGICVVREIMDADNVLLKTKLLKEKLEEVLK